MADLLSVRKLAVRETFKQQKFNNARAIIVLRKQKHLSDLWIAAPKTHEQRHGVNFLPNFAAVVLEKAKVQQYT